MQGKKLLKAAAMLAVLIYCSLFAYYTKATPPIFDKRSPAVHMPQSKDLINDNVIGESDNNNQNIQLDDIFISVKTTRHHQHTRLPIILKTWFQLAKQQTWFFTDIDNPYHQKLTDGHMVNTNCSASHHRKHLCCKLAVEYDNFLDSGKKWFCHFDDDNYVNVPQLVKFLNTYDPQLDWYLGKTSIYKPLPYTKTKNMKPFWFATGGAGFCLSKALALKMDPIASGGRIMTICENIRYPDDVTLGYIVENLMNTRLTLVPEFHSHLEQMKFLDAETFRDQISFGYYSNKGEWNVIRIPGFDTNYDPTRFLSLHCFLFPHFSFCPRKR